ncbi:MAG: hypothetical protein KDH94_05490 [Coxiellaceae bacterium]|nr:hypothetical protein [Coxiellaceae bacterium]
MFKSFRQSIVTVVKISFTLISLALLAGCLQYYKPPAQISHAKLGVFHSGGLDRSMIVILQDPIACTGERRLHGAGTGWSKKLSLIPGNRLVTLAVRHVFYGSTTLYHTFSFYSKANSVYYVEFTPINNDSTKLRFRLLRKVTGPQGETSYQVVRFVERKAKMSGWDGAIEPCTDYALQKRLKRWL